jgi:hypothetical protein
LPCFTCFAELVGGVIKQQTPFEMCRTAFDVAATSHAMPFVEGLCGPFCERSVDQYFEGSGFPFALAALSVLFVSFHGGQQV